MKNFKVTASTGKIMTTVFGGSHGFTMSAYVPKGSAVTGAHYDNKIRQL